MEQVWTFFEAEWPLPVFLYEGFQEFSSSLRERFIYPEALHAIISARKNVKIELGGTNVLKKTT